MNKNIRCCVLVKTVSVLVVFSHVFSGCNSKPDRGLLWRNWCSEIHTSDTIPRINDIKLMRESFVNEYNERLIQKLIHAFPNQTDLQRAVAEGQLGLQYRGDTLFQLFHGDFQKEYAQLTYPFRQGDATEFSSVENCFYLTIDYLFAVWAIEQEVGFVYLPADFVLKPN